MGAFRRSSQSEWWKPWSRADCRANAAAKRLRGERIAQRGALGEALRDLTARPRCRRACGGDRRSRRISRRIATISSGPVSAARRTSRCWKQGSARSPIGGEASPLRPCARRRSSALLGHVDHGQKRLAHAEEQQRVRRSAATPGLVRLANRPRSFETCSSSTSTGVAPNLGAQKWDAAGEGDVRAPACSARPLQDVMSSRHRFRPSRPVSTGRSSACSCHTNGGNL